MLMFVRNVFFTAVMASLISACGSAGSDSAATAATGPASQTANAGSSSSYSISSAGPALANTTALSPDDLNVYVTQNVNLPISELIFDGHLRVVKIRSALNKTLFLGQWPKGSDFEMPIYAELAAFPLMVEVFTESQSDETVTWEVRYEG